MISHYFLDFANLCSTIKKIPEPFDSGIHIEVFVCIYPFNQASRSAFLVSSVD